MKYVIDIPENMTIKSALNGLTLGITMRVPSNNQDFVIPTNIQLEPYTEPDIYLYTDNPTGWELYQDYQKAKEKYETWKKQKDKIKIGEEYHNGLKWTSVEKTPPPSEENVLVSCVDYSGDTPFKYTNVGWITPDHRNWIVDNEVNWNVIAWAPLPEPYGE